MSIEFAIVLATFLGPIFAVGITLWYQASERKVAAKERVFLTLMTYRRSPPSFEWVMALNVIDAVFAEHPDVTKAWKDLYDYAHVRPVDNVQFDNLNAKLLAEMAKALGYSKLDLTSLSRVYSPEAIGAQMRLQNEIQAELLRVLKGTERIEAAPRAAPAPGGISE